MEVGKVRANRRMLLANLAATCYASASYARRFRGNDVRSRYFSRGVIFTHARYVTDELCHLTLFIILIARDRWLNKIYLHIIL